MKRHSALVSPTQVLAHFPGLREPILTYPGRSAWWEGGVTFSFSLRFHGFRFIKGLTSVNSIVLRRQRTLKGEGIHFFLSSNLAGNSYFSQEIKVKVIYLLIYFLLLVLFCAPSLRGVCTGSVLDWSLSCNSFI